MKAQTPPKSVRRVTLKDVAMVAGLHVGTVSRALAGTGEVAESTRERVRAAAAELGYAPDPMLHALASYRKGLRPETFHGTLAWLLTDQHSDAAIYTGLLANQKLAAAAAKKLGYRLEEFRLEDTPPGRMERVLRARGIQGLLLPPQIRPGTKLRMDLEGFSAVTIGYTLESPRLSCVVPHQYENTRMLLRELRRRGCRRIGFWLPKIIDNRTHGAFSAGFWRAQQDLPAAEQVSIGLPESFDEKAFVRWYRKEKPDHLIGIPAAFAEWLGRAGLPGVPVSFPGNLEECDARKGELRVDENWERIYEVALRMLDGMIRHRETGVPRFPRVAQIQGVILG